MTQMRPQIMTARRHRGDSPGLRRTVVVLEVLTAVGAVLGGTAMIRNPLTPLGTTTDLISGSPFATYTWPGVLLLLLNGVVPTVLAIGLASRVRGAMVLSAAWGFGLMAWIAVQWLLLTDVLWLQFVLFAVGAVVAACAVVAVRRGVR